MRGAAAVLVVLAATAAAGTAASDPWTHLRRPLRIPHRAAGSACPVTPTHQVSPGSSPVQGAGPVYPTAGSLPTVPFEYPPAPDQLWSGSKWGGQKILWIARPTYRGLIRGRQLDGPNELRFGGGLVPAREMRLTSVGGHSPGGWQNRPSYTRLRAAGCYAWQVDGTTFSRVIVFRAVVSES